MVAVRIKARARGGKIPISDMYESYEYTRASESEADHMHVWNICSVLPRMAE